MKFSHLPGGEAQESSAAPLRYTFSWKQNGTLQAEFKRSERFGGHGE